MKKSKIFILVCIISLMCGACKNDIEADNNCEEADKTTNVTADVVEPDTDKELSFSKLIMTVMYNYPRSENCNVRYFLCIMNDGSLYATTYTYEGSGFSSDFFKKLYSCDNDAWNYVENVELLGMLSEEKVSLINEKMKKININSDYFDIYKDRNGMYPEGIETTSYVVYCYITSDDNGRERFKVIEGGKFNGWSYKTYDESAIAILDAVLEDELYDVWEKQHISNLNE